MQVYLVRCPLPSPMAVFQTESSQDTEDRALGQTEQAMI